MTKILDNIILFPGKENSQLIEIEQELAIIQKKMKALMNLNDFDLHPIDNKDVEPSEISGENLKSVVLVLKTQFNLFKEQLSKFQDQEGGKFFIFNARSIALNVSISGIKLIPK